MRPKADEIAAYTQLRALNQGNKTLSMYIQEVRRLVGLCNLDCNADKDKLIRNSVIARINSTKAYQQCILKGSSLSLEDCIKICQIEDATCRQVQTLHPESSSDCSDSTPIHKILNQHQPHTIEAGQATGEEMAPTGVEGPTEATGPDPGRTTGTVQHRYVKIAGESQSTQSTNRGI